MYHSIIGLSTGITLISIICSKSILSLEKKCIIYIVQYISPKNQTSKHHNHTGHSQVHVTIT